MNSADLPAMNVTSVNSRVFNENGCATIVMGDGCTIVSDVVYSDDGLCGICFSENGVNLGIGADHEYLNGKSTDEIKPYMQILSKNPESLRVIVSRLEDAIAALSNNNWDDK